MSGALLRAHSSLVRVFGERKGKGLCDGFVAVGWGGNGNGMGMGSAGPKRIDRSIDQSSNQSGNLSISQSTNKSLSTER